MAHSAFRVYATSTTSNTHPRIMRQLADLNLLAALDALLDEQSVTGAARRMGLSTPAMSRTLGRIREVIGDEILVRAGNRLVPTTRADALREQVRKVVEDAALLLQPQDDAQLRQLTRRFTIRANDAFISAFGYPLLAKLRETAPGIVLRFTPEHVGDDDALRDGTLDLIISAPGDHTPEIRVQTLFVTTFVGLARAEHPLFEAPITPERFAAFEQISVTRRGRAVGPIDFALEELGLKRSVPLIAPSFSAAVFASLGSDLLLPVAEHLVWGLERVSTGLRAFDIPLTLPPVTLQQAWHPRMQNDGPHRWLRNIVKGVCAH
jgi:DNA-binding transcriptional LysR family regulator